MTSLDAITAFTRYEAIRPRLPVPTDSGASQYGYSLADTATAYDGFILDAFGVLNVGETAIAGAVERMAELRTAGKKLMVLTNAASYPADTAAARYHSFGFDFQLEQIVSSRDVAAQQLQHIAPDCLWAAIATEDDRFGDLPADVADLLADDELWARAGGFLFLSSQRWTQALQTRLIQALNTRPRPVVVANPDLVAPRDTGLSIEPGYWGHDLADRTGQLPHFFGKPFPEAFDIARARMGPGRLAMVGDTLHTDILGGSAADLGTVLITRHGLFAGNDVGPYIQTSGINPSWIVETT